MTATAALTARRPHRSGLPDEPAIRLMIVDDSSVARAVLSRMVTGQDGFQVVATAASAAEARSVLQHTSVDIIMLDLEMPGVSGLDALPDILDAGRGARVLIVSSSAEDGAGVTVRALALGAADTMPKPGSGMFGGRFSEILSERLRQIGRVGITHRDGVGVTPPSAVTLRETDEWQPDCIAIGASTGGIQAINDFLAGLPARTGLPIFVTQHLPPLFMPYFARQLADAAGRPARVVSQGEVVEADQVHVAPGNAHLRIVRRGATVRVKLDTNPAPSGCLPSVDPMMESVGDTYGRGGLGVVLSGMGRDGLIGSGRLVDRGGVVLAQDQCSAAIWGMPRAVAEAGLATAVLSPRDLARCVATRLGEAAWK